MDNKQFAGWLRLFDKIPKPLAIKVGSLDYNKLIEIEPTLRISRTKDIKDTMVNHGKSRWIVVLEDCDLWKTKHYEMLEQVMKTRVLNPVICEFYDLGSIPKKSRPWFVHFDDFPIVEYKQEKWPPISLLGKVKCRARFTKFWPDEEEQSE